MDIKLFAKKELKTLIKEQMIYNQDMRMESGKEKYTMQILFTNPSARTGYNTRSIFKWSLTGLNLEFSFSYTSCLTKA